MVLDLHTPRARWRSAPGNRSDRLRTMPVMGASATHTGNDPAQEAMGEVCCPCCGYDLRGILSTWSDASPLEIMCSECGASVATSELFREERIEKFFETAASGLAASWLTTSLRALRPRFWREISPSMPVHRQRLAQFALTWAMALPLMTHLTAAAVAMHVLRPVLLPRQQGEWLFLLLWPYGNDPQEGLQFFTSFLVDRFLLVMPLLVMPLLAGLWLRIVARHSVSMVGRAVCYALPMGAVLLSATTLATALTFSAPAWISATAMLLVLGAFAAWLTLWWREFASRHLAWRYPTSATVLLLVAAVAITVLVGFGRASLAGMA